MMAGPSSKLWWGTPAATTYAGSVKWKNASPKNGAFKNPAKRENTARTMRGTVMTRGDSWGCPCPRYSPKNVRYTHRVM